MLPHIYITGFYPSGVVCESFDYRFGVSAASEPFDPVLTLIKRAKDCGCAVKAALGQFKEEFDICPGQIREEPFVQHKYLESRIFVEDFYLAARNHRFFSVLIEQVGKTDIACLILLTACFLPDSAAKEGLA